MIPSADTILSRFVVRAKLRHMQVLVKLVELGSMRRAAEAIQMTQPAVSQKVSELERLIGAELFFRHAKGVEPTDVARVLVPVAERIMTALQDGSEAVAQSLKANAGVVRVAASPAAIGGLLLETLGPFCEAHPAIQIRIIEITGSGPIGADVFEEADVICTRQPQVAPEGWVFVPCLDDRLVVVCGAGHALAGQRDITPEKLGQNVWLMNRVGSIARQKFEVAFETHGWSEKSRGSLVMHVPELTRHLLETQELLAILPQSVAAPWLRGGGICILETSISEPLPPLGLMHPEKTSDTVVGKFVSYVKAQVQNQY